MGNLIAFVVVVGGGTLLTIALVYFDSVTARRLTAGRFRKDRQSLDAIGGEKRVRIGEARDGRRVRITGRVTQVRAALAAPLSHRACGYWEVTAVEGARGSLREVGQGHAGTPVIVEDGSGRAIVDLASARVAVHQDHEVSSNAFGTSNELKAWLKVEGLLESLPRGFDLTTVEAREGVIAVGEVISIVGRARWEPDPDGVPSLRGAMPRRLIVEPDDDGTLLVTDERSVVFGDLSRP